MEYRQKLIKRKVSGKKMEEETLCGFFYYLNFSGSFLQTSQATQATESDSRTQELWAKLFLPNFYFPSTTSFLPPLWPFSKYPCTLKEGEILKNIFQKLSRIYYVNFFCRFVFWSNCNKIQNTKRKRKETQLHLK